MIINILQVSYVISKDMKTREKLKIFSAKEYHIIDKGFWSASEILWEYYLNEHDN